MSMNVSTSVRRCLGLCNLLLGFLLVQGCATSDPEGAFAEVPVGDVASQGNGTGAIAAAPNPIRSVSVPSAKAPVSEWELIRRGESLFVTFSDLPPGAALPVFEERVKEDGTVTLHLNQVFVAADKTRGQLEKEIRERYVPSQFQRLTVTVQPKERSYTIGGDVKAPNRYAWFNGMTVLKAIQAAGDFTDFAKKTKVQVTRANGRKELVNCVKALREQSLDILIYPGDTIHVPRRGL